MSDLSRPQGIDGLHGRKPVLCAVTVGRKAANGRGIVDKDRFHIVQRRENAAGVKPYCAEFRSFNEIPTDSTGKSIPVELDRRKVIRGTIVHAKRAQCFDWSLKAQVLDKKHPNRMPACVGDGKRAVRWMGGEPDNFKEILCPGRRCEFQQGKQIRGYTVVPCKPWMQLVFQLRWPKGVSLPTPLAVFSSGSWNTTANFYGISDDGTPQGFFGEIEVAASELGIQDISLFGYPFMLTVREQTKPSAKARFPVVDVTPEMSPIEFFAAQSRLRSEIGTFPEPVPLLENRTVEEEFEDARGLTIDVPNSFEG